MKKEKFISLLSKKLSGGLFGKELDLLEEEIRTNEEYGLLFNKLQGYVNERKSHRTTPERLEQIWKKIETAENEGFDDTTPKRISFPRIGFIKAAALLVLCCGAGFLGYRMLNNKQDFENFAAGDNKTFRMLDDGTKIWLNKKSTISYNTAFGKHEREIKLEGEAYFDVARNKDVPLIVHVGGIDIEVKGTAFNVNAYDESGEIQVALIRGEIQVTNRLHSKNQLILKPNEKLTFSNLQSTQNQDNFTVMSLTSEVLQKDIKWTADTLTFRKEKLKDLVVRMEKKYDLKIEVQSEQLSEKRFSGTFTTETIQQALEALKLSYPLTYTISNRLVTIKD